MGNARDPPTARPRRATAGAIGAENSMPLRSGRTRRRGRSWPIWRKPDRRNAVCQINRFAREVRFGDGTHGAIPPAGSDIRVCYTLSADEAVFGNTQLSAPRGLAARYNAQQDRYDVYVCDSRPPAPRSNGRTGPTRRSIPHRGPCHSPPGIRPPRRPIFCRARAISNSWNGTARFTWWCRTARGLLIYRDDATPVFVAAIDSALGPWGDPAGLAVMAEDSGLQIYAADAARGTVT